MKTKSSFSVLIFFVILAIGIALAYASYDLRPRLEQYGLEQFPSLLPF